MCVCVCVCMCVLCASLSLPPSPTSHIAENKDIIRLLVAGYDKPQVHALSCGLMLRDCIKKDQLIRLITEDEVRKKRGNSRAVKYVHLSCLVSLHHPAFQAISRDCLLYALLSHASNADAVLQVFHLCAKPAIRYCCRRVYVLQGTAHAKQDSHCKLS